MPTLIAGVVAVVVLYSALQMFRAANPAVLARAIKIGGGVLALIGLALGRQRIARAQQGDQPPAAPARS